jgi:CRP-like cAMP-binding protein
MANPFKDYIVKLRAGDFVFKEGDPGTEMYIVQSGTVEVFSEGPRGRNLLAVMEKGDFFGEMALLDGDPHMASARALEDVEVIEINSTLFDRMIKANAEIAVRMLRKLSIRLREANRNLGKASPVAPATDASPMPPQRPRAAEAAIPAEAARTKVEPAPAPQSQPLDLPPIDLQGCHAIFLSEEGGEKFPISSDKAVMGRFDPVTGLKPEVDLSNADINRSVSRQHARLTQEAGVYYLCEEPGALNGTFINGRKLITGKPTRVRDGDAVTLGMVKMTFRESRKG